MNNEYKLTDNEKNHCQGCGCGGHGHSEHDNGQKGCCGKEQEPINLSREELEILLELKEYSYLPIAEFVMCSSVNDHVRFTALAPVYIEKIDDSMEKVKKTGSVFSELEKKKLISLDYDIPLKGFDYTIYTKSELYQYFIDSINQGKEKKDFICDTPEIECGSVALTDLGKRAVDSITVIN